MKILLVAPYKASYLGLAKFPPIGLGYLAGALRKKGYEPVILDCLKENIDSSGYRQYLEQHKPDIVGINSWSLSVKEVKEILEITKSVDGNIITIVGGPHPSAVPLEAMSFFSSADFGFRGEAEVGLSLFVDILSGKLKSSYSDVPGLIYKEGSTWVVNPQSLPYDLDQFDLAWDLVKPEEYCTPGAITSGHTAAIITTRGCPFMCTFCSPHIIAGRKVRKRSTENVIAEIRLLKEKYGMRTIAIMDENFTFYRDHAYSLCQRLVKEKIKIRLFLPNGIRLDTLDEELLKTMRRAGFSSSVAVGIESGSERILKMIRKNLKKEVVKEKIKLMIKCGYRPIGYFILGFPGETVNEMYETLRFAKELRLFRAGFSPLLVLPGTDIYNELKAKGELPADYDFSRLATDNLTSPPEGISREEFYRIKKDIIWKFNLQPRVILDYLHDFNSFVFASIKFKEIFLKKHKNTGN